MYFFIVGIKSVFSVQTQSAAFRLIYLTKFFECEIAEAYLGFVHNAGSDVQNAILILEKEETSAINIYGIMESCKIKLEAKRDAGFFGSIASSVLTSCDNTDLVKRFEREASEYLTKNIEYIKKKYHFDEKFKLLAGMKLTSEPIFNDFVSIINKFKIEDIELDSLFDEFVQLKKYWTQTKHTHTSSSVERWVDFFRHNNIAPNLQSLCEHIFSLPVSNAMCERVFSLMNTAWRKERNRLSIETLQAELLIKNNFNMGCRDFEKFLKNDPIGKRILNKISKSDKY